MPETIEPATIHERLLSIAFSTTPEGEHSLSIKREDGKQRRIIGPTFEPDSNNSRRQAIFVLMEHLMWEVRQEIFPFDTLVIKKIPAEHGAKFIAEGYPEEVGRTNQQEWS